MALMTGPLSPYVTPEQLTSAPTGISWQTIPDQRASDAAKYAEIVNICQRATSMADSWCNQVLRSTIQTETLYGPGDFRVNQYPNGTTRLLLSQWPITQITGIRVANAASFPYQWAQVVPGSWAIERPALLLTGTSVAADSGTGGQSVILGPGYVNWYLGRGGYVIETTTAAGWPHCGITQAATAGDAVLHVDDCTGWGPASPGAATVTGVIYDTAGNQEAVTCLASSVTSGPGILSLAAGLTYDHDPGVTVSTLPSQVQWATVLYCASLALARGATATMIQTMGGGGGNTAAGSAELSMQADILLDKFRRVI